MYATISADIVQSTSLEIKEMLFLRSKVQELLNKLEVSFPGFWGRLVRGDSIECVTDKPQDAFRIILILKCYVKSLNIRKSGAPKELKRFGIRSVIGLGSMRMVDREHDFMDGEAIYLSGRALDQKATLMKGTLLVEPSESFQNKALNAIAALVDALLNRATARQCEVLFHRFFGEREQEIARQLVITQSAVNQHLASAGWTPIEKALDYYETLNFSDYEP